MNEDHIGILKDLAETSKDAIFASFVVFPDGRVWEYTRIISPEALSDTSLVDFYMSDFKFQLKAMLLSSPQADAVDSGEDHHH